MSLDLSPKCSFWTLSKHVIWCLVSCCEVFDGPKCSEKKRHQFLFVPAECRTNYIQRPVSPPLSKVLLAGVLDCVIAGVLSPPGPCMRIFSKVCCCVRGSLVQICYISFADIMGSGTEWYHCRPQPFLSDCLPHSMCAPGTGLTLQC